MSDQPTIALGEPIIIDPATSPAICPQRFTTGSCRCCAEVDALEAECSLCHAPKARGDCPHMIEHDGRVVLSRERWERWASELTAARNATATAEDARAEVKRLRDKSLADSREVERLADDVERLRADLTQEQDIFSERYAVMRAWILAEQNPDVGAAFLDAQRAHEAACARMAGERETAEADVERLLGLLADALDGWRSDHEYWCGCDEPPSEIAEIRRGAGLA